MGDSDQTHPDSSLTVARGFIQDHRRLEAIFLEWHAALENGDHARALVCWTQFRDGLLRHMRAEENVLIPELLIWRRRTATPIVEEHRHLRNRLSELDARMQANGVPIAGARGFIDELRAHMAHEETAVYGWADGHIAPSKCLVALAALDDSSSPVRDSPGETPEFKP